MTSPYNSSMFESIKSAIARNDSGSVSRKDYIKTEPGNTYIVRLLPNIKNPTKTIFRYYTFAWKSFSTGQNVLVTSPTTWNQRDPIAEERYRIYRNGTPDEKEKVKAIRRGENWMVNAYVISDPVNPDNNGKVKVLRYGRQLNKIVESAMNEEADDLGARIFDLSSNGCSFSIKCEKQGDYPTYVSSKFKLPREVEGLNPNDHAKLYDGIFDLESMISVKPYEELKATLDQHYNCVETDATSAPAIQTLKTESSPMMVVEPRAAQPSPARTPEAITDDEINNLLKSLDS